MTQTTTATYRWKTLGSLNQNQALAQEIAVGQSVGAIDLKYTTPAEVEFYLAKVTDLSLKDEICEAKIQFPWSLWHGKIDWLFTLLFGKLSFYYHIQLVDLEFSDGDFLPADGSEMTAQRPELSGPKWKYSQLAALAGAHPEKPMLMGILKPNVALKDQALADLIEMTFDSGCHLVKDDEIRHDLDFNLTLRRLEKVVRRLENSKCSGIYVPHVPYQPNWLQKLKAVEELGIQAVLINVMSCGWAALQEARNHSKLILVAHPALMGGFHGGGNWRVAPNVLMGSLVRAAGADLSLFPSPYGKIGLSPQEAQDVVMACRSPKPHCLSTTPVPSAGIKPEHGPLALRDFGSKGFILNAGTAIFAQDSSVAHQISLFRKALDL